jgi:hypothetical protein
MNDYPTESSQSANYAVCGILIYIIGNFIDDLQSFLSSSACTDPEIFGHPLLNFPAMSDRCIPKWKLCNKQLNIPLKNESAGRESQFPNSGSL